MARFAALGVPALNFGPGDPNLAHTRDEHVELRRSAKARPCCAAGWQGELSACDSSTDAERPSGTAGRSRCGAARSRAPPPTSACSTRGPGQTGRQKDAWRALRILSEFVEGFDTLADLPPAVSVFGSARSKPDSPECELAERLGAALARAGYAVITGGGPGRHGGGQPGRQRGRRPVGRARHRAAVRAGHERVGRHRHRLPLLLRPQDHVRQVRAGVRACCPAASAPWTSCSRR